MSGGGGAGFGMPRTSALGTRLASSSIVHMPLLLIVRSGTSSEASEIVPPETLKTLQLMFQAASVHSHTVMGATYSGSRRTGIWGRRISTAGAAATGAAGGTAAAPPPPARVRPRRCTSRRGARGDGVAGHAVAAKVSADDARQAGDARLG